MQMMENVLIHISDVSRNGQCLQLEDVCEKLVWKTVA